MSGLSVAAFCARESSAFRAFSAGRHSPPRRALRRRHRRQYLRRPLSTWGVLASGAASRLELKLDLGGSLVLHLVRG